MVPRSCIGLARPAPRLPSRAKAVRAGGFLSVLFHLAVVAAVTLATARAASVATGTRAASAPPASLPRMVFLQMPLPGGGGGGGGTREPLPPPRARDAGHDGVTLPVARPLVAAQEPLDAAPPPEQAMLDTVPQASGTALLTGLPDAWPSPALSGGPGAGGGIGTGTGTGLGSGTGPGLGPGSGGGFGGGAYRPGGGVVAPTLLRQVIPKYTADALERKIQGTVVLEVVVGRDGVPAAIRVARSLDRGGLDQEAIAAVRQWRFTPGRLGDTPVDVLVTIWVDFRVV